MVVSLDIDSFKFSLLDFDEADELYLYLRNSEDEASARKNVTEMLVDRGKRNFRRRVKRVKVHALKNRRKARRNTSIRARRFQWQHPRKHNPLQLDLWVSQNVPHDHEYVNAMKSFSTTYHQTWMGDSCFVPWQSQSNSFKVARLPGKKSKEWPSNAMEGIEGGLKHLVLEKNEEKVGRFSASQAAREKIAEDLSIRRRFAAQKKAAEEEKTKQSRLQRVNRRDYSTRTELADIYSGKRMLLQAHQQSKVETVIGDLNS